MLKNYTDNKNLSLDNVCYLIDKTYTTDDYMQKIEHESQTMQFCAEISIHSNEFFKAGQSGIKSTKALVVDSEGYADETEVIYNDKKYTIYRVYPRSDGMTELYLTEKSGV